MEGGNRIVYDYGGNVNHADETTSLLSNTTLVEVDKKRNEPDDLGVLPEGP